MILLASTSDLVRVVTEHAATIDVMASWSDLNGTTVTPGRTNTLISTATTTTVVGSPGSSTYRTLKQLIVRNRSTLDGCHVQIVHTDGTNAVELMEAILMPGDTLAYNEHDAFRVFRAPYGNLSSSHDSVWISPTVGATYTHILPVDVTNANATANRLVDVQDLRFPVIESQRYWFCFTLMFTTASTGTGSRWCIYGPGSPTALRYNSEVSLSTTTKTNNEGLSIYDTPVSSSASSAATGSNIATIEGFVDQPTCNGFVFLRFASEVLSSAVTLKAGSRLEWQRVT